MTKEELSKLYDENFKLLMKEAKTCSCWAEEGTSRKCSNPKHFYYVTRERELDKISRKR